MLVSLNVNLRQQQSPTESPVYIYINVYIDLRLKCHLPFVLFGYLSYSEMIHS